MCGGRRPRKAAQRSRSSVERSGARARAEPSLPTDPLQGDVGSSRSPWPPAALCDTAVVGERAFTAKRTTQRHMPPWLIATQLSQRQGTAGRCFARATPPTTNPSAASRRQNSAQNEPDRVCGHVRNAPLSPRRSELASALDAEMLQRAGLLRQHARTRTNAPSTPC